VKANGTPLPDEPPLAGALPACADGLYPAELLIRHSSWLCRDDFRDGFVGVGTSITDGTTLMAAIDWLAAITASTRAAFPSAESNAGCSVLPRAWPPVDLRDAFTGMDTANANRAVGAMLHASGRRPGRH
jgi:hypothetical protein